MNTPVEFLENEAIWEAADKFRESAQLSGHNRPPIDVVYIVDVVLKFDVIDIPEMFTDLRMDAAIVPSEQAIYMDREALERWDRKDHWIERRLRFTVAHELGHLILHENYMAEAVFSDIAIFKRWMLKHQQDRRVEDQADEFAGRFLVPLEILRASYDQYVQEVAKADQNWRDIEGMREHIAKKLAPRFGVNHQVIETRFDHEGIWPAE
ncbi:MAG: ImmA/IrrE family metallo-endopeptidase [Kiritimatiellae bacterium]|nr:ImmA/IrrE family metallo-endopeptidase [Kiritimatiellia bacterium]